MSWERWLMALFGRRRSPKLQDEQERIAEAHRQEMERARQLQARLRVLGAESETLRVYARRREQQ